MLQLPADLSFFDEPADEITVFAKVVAEHSDGDVAPEVGVAPFKTSPMPPRAISPSIR